VQGAGVPDDSGICVRRSGEAMQHSPAPPTDQVALVTGGARRVGAAVVRALHGTGMRVVVHYHRSETAARELVDELQRVRPGSAGALGADLLDPDTPAWLAAGALARWGRLDVLVNNASSFYPTPLGTVTETDWNDLLATNLRAPFFLAQAAAPLLADHRGCIVNLTDVYAERPLSGHPVYSIAKAGLAMLTRSLARELGPAVRVNAVAPGAILWPEPAPGAEPGAGGEASQAARRRIVARTPLARQGEPDDIARAVLFLVRDAGFVTGETVTVDGGRHVVP